MHKLKTLLVAGLLSGGLAATVPCAVQRDGPSRAPVKAQWRELSLNKKSVVTGSFFHPDLDMNASRVRLTLAGSEVKKDSYFRKLVRSGRLASLTEIAGGVRLRVNAVGFSRAARDVRQIRVIFRSAEGDKLGSTRYTVRARRSMAD